MVMVVGRSILQRAAIRMALIPSAAATPTASARSFSVSIPRPKTLGSLGFRGSRALTSVSLPGSSAQRAVSLRAYSTVRTESSLNDPSPNWSNRPPKETILLDGCDFEHWLVVMEPPQGNPSRDEIIESYIKTLAQVVGSEEEARMKMYSVSTKHYFAFGALVSEELSYKIKPLPGVRWVLPDSYLDPRTKSYGGEPFINGQAVPYDPKYHEEWVRNNARCNERRSNDRPRNFDRSRNFERRREMQQQTRAPPPPPPQANYQQPPPPPQANYQQPPQQSNYQQQPPQQPPQSNWNPGRQAPPQQSGYPNQAPPPPQGYSAPPHQPQHSGPAPPMPPPGGYPNQG